MALMKILSAFALLIFSISSTLSAQTQNASVVATCRSIAMDVYSGDVAGVGIVHNHVSTYDGKPGLPLYQFRPDGSIFFSQELRPRAGGAGLYEADYITFDDFGNGLDYGSFTVNFPTADDDGNGLADFLQQHNATQANVTGSVRSDAFGTVWAVTGSFGRPIDSSAGSYSVTLTYSSGPNPLPKPVTYTGTGAFRLVNASGSISYSRPDNSATFSLVLVQQGTTRTLTGTTSFSVASAEQINFPQFNLRSNDGFNYPVKAFTLRRTANRYSGSFQFSDGNPATSWADYIDWVLEIADPNDANANGIPDLSDAVLPPTAGQLLNISSRVRVQTGDDAMIGGFIITGDAAKEVIVRAIGPSLQQAGIADVLSDPVLELHDSTGALITANDNWKDTQQAQIVASGIAPANDAESAIISILAPGAYTAVVRGQNGTSGIGVVEVYDLNQAAAARLGNISTRGFVDTGDQVMIGGFIVGGGFGDKTQVVVRALGPSLEAFGVGNALQDPTLSLIDRNGNVIASNDNWQDAPQPEVIAAGLAPADPRESALFVALPRGSYTAIVAGKDGTTGVGLIEEYGLR